jgi:5-methyltetrahydrofolate--homocysteine methyltransferase
MLNLPGDRILLFDGATGTYLRAQRFPASAYGGEAHRNLLEALNLHGEDAVLQMHLDYLSAGADIIETNTFSGHPLTLAEWGLEARAEAVNAAGASLARRAAEPFPGTLVAGSIGPTPFSLLLDPARAPFAAVRDGFKLQGRALLENGADFLMIETVQDPVTLKAALVATRELSEERGTAVPLAVSLTVEPTGTTAAGFTIPAFVALCLPFDPLFLGLNCSLGPAALYAPLLELARLAPRPILLMPNAGLPDASGHYTVGPEEFAGLLRRHASAGLLNLAGGCCGTGPAHIAALKGALSGLPPRFIPPAPGPMLCGLEAQPLDQKPAPFLIGERANTLGSRAFRGAVEAGDQAGAAEVLRLQALRGAHALDLRLNLAGRDEATLWRAFLPSLSRASRLPFVIDSSDPAAVEAALEGLPGRALINSITLEDPDRTAALARLAGRHGAAVVASLIDEEGMARSAERKWAVASRLLERLEEHGVPADAVLLDPLTFPAATAAPEVGATLDFIAHFRGARSLLGISNVSHGLPKVLRRPLNRVFLQMALERGLAAAILNPDDLADASAVPPERRREMEAFLLTGDAALLQRLRALYEGDLPPAPPPNPTLVERLVLGLGSGLEADLDRRLRDATAMELIAGPLLEGMEEVGRRFADGRMIITEVLRSAEVFAQAMRHLEPHLPREAYDGRPSIVLATVRGDVHDIGKNLVGMVFRAYGFSVADLGVRVPPEAVAAAVERERPTCLGLSGLLLASVDAMRDTLALLRDRGHRLPVLVGGAALSRALVETVLVPAYAPGAVRYAKDPLEGVRLAREHA